MEVLILGGLIVLNGLFALAEIAMVTAKRARLQALAEQGQRSARVALRLTDDPTGFLSTVQIGITSIGILNGIYGESVLASPFALWLQSLGVAADTATWLATVLVVVVVTYLTIVVGELVPKRIGQLHAERLACWVAPTMAGLAFVAVPAVKLLSWSTQAILHLLRVRASNDAPVTEDDIHALLAEGSSTGVIQPHEHDLVRQVFRFDERPVASLMVPRADIAYLDVNASPAAIHARILASPHNHFPLADGQVDNLLGVVKAKDVLAQIGAGAPLTLHQLASACTFVLPSLNALELLQRFRQSDTRMVFVVDEYGDLKGLVTVRDLMEAMTGDFYTQADDDAYIVQRADGSYLLDGLLPVLDVKDLLGIDDTLGGNYQTLSGLIMALLDKVPVTGEAVELGQWRFEIVDMDGRRIDKVLATCTGGDRSG